jgi:hypothetical protein
MVEGHQFEFYRRFLKKEISIPPQERLRNTMGTPEFYPNQEDTT